MCKRAKNSWPQGHSSTNLVEVSLGDATNQICIKALGLGVSDKKIFKIFILKIYF